MDISSIENKIELFLEHFKSAQSVYLEQHQVMEQSALDVLTPGEPFCEYSPGTI